MSIRNQNWYNLQSTRSYPLDEGSTCVDDAGVFVRNDILVDCHIKFPSTIGAQMYVQGITISAGLVTVLFGVTGGQTVAVFSEPKPVTPYINYAVTGLVSGISGWIVFGPGIAEDFIGRYTAINQTALSPRCARPYRPLPIPTIGKLNLTTALEGVVNLIALTPVTMDYETVKTSDDVQHPAIVLRLDKSLISTTYNPLVEFLGPCGQRPESGTCPKKPIETINGVEPDCNGNINIEFVGFDAANFSDCGGIDILTDISLADVCAANKPKKPYEFSDDCCDPGSPIFDGINEYCWPDPNTQLDLIVDETTFNPAYACMLLPFCLDFSSCDLSTYFDVRSGLFVPEKTNAPQPCVCGCLDLYPDYGWIAIEANYGVGDWVQIQFFDCTMDPRKNVSDVLQTYVVASERGGTQQYRLRFQTEDGSAASDWFYSNTLVQIPDTQPTAVTGNPLCGYSAIPGFSVCEVLDTAVGITKNVEVYWGDIQPTTSETNFTDHYTYATQGTATKNIAVLRNCPTDWVVGKTVETQLKISVNGVERNGGLVLGYRQTPVNGVAVSTYFVVLIDVLRAKLRVLRYNNSQFIEEMSTNFSFQVRQWYTISATTSYDTGLTNKLNLTFAVKDTLSGDELTTGSVQINAADYVNGFYGLFTDKSYTFFNKFQVS